jgi:nicotinamidase-related amidase
MDTHTETNKLVKVLLLIIDPQNDFIIGTLKVEGSEEDCLRIARFIDMHKNEIDSIKVTLDMHPENHISFPNYWLTSKNEHPEPFTLITLNACIYNEFRPVEFRNTLRVGDYLCRVGQHTVWPSHCVVGTDGCKVIECISSVLETMGDKVEYHEKGTDKNFEMYSAFSSTNPSYPKNYDLMHDICEDYTHVIVVGEALSHCVKDTLNDLLDYRDALKFNTQFILLKDCSSPVPDKNKPDLKIKLIEQFRKRGVIISDSTSFDFNSIKPKTVGVKRKLTDAA